MGTPSREVQPKFRWWWPHGLVDHAEIRREIDQYLHRGVNAIEIEVATTLRNRLRLADPLVYGGAARQSYGLVGPVRLVPYGEARIRG
jgi:hypothetical protein